MQTLTDYPKKFERAAQVFANFAKQHPLPPAKGKRIFLVVCDKRGAVFGEMNVHHAGQLGTGDNLIIQKVAEVAGMALAGAGGPGGDMAALESLLKMVATDPVIGRRIADCLEQVRSAVVVLLVRGDAIHISVQAA